MLKIAAWTSGRSSVSEYDCLLLQHTFWQRPEDAEKIFRWLIERIGESGAGLKQAQYLLAELYNRACRQEDKLEVDRDSDEGQALKEEVTAIREMLESRFESMQ
eukprot:5093578-Ditylum_brightwellii.AAC.1